MAVPAATATANCTITNPDGSTSTSSVTLSGGQSSSLSFTYNPAYGGNSQAYTVSSSVGSVMVTVYAVLPTITLSGADGASDGSTNAAATFMATGGSSGATATVDYTVSGPGAWESNSISLSGGQSGSLSFVYNPAYGGEFPDLLGQFQLPGRQRLRYSRCYPRSRWRVRTGGGDGSTSATATFTATGGSSGQLRDGQLHDHESERIDKH